MRERFSLEKEWKFSRESHSILPKLIDHNHVYGFAKAGGLDGVAKSNYNDEDWEIVNIPHDWQVEEEFDVNASPNHGYKKRSVCWYRRKFCLKEADINKRIIIEFEGIAGVSSIYFNGSKVAYNESGYNSFFIDITDLANYGSNPNILAIQVDNREWEGWWYEGGGIYRHVWLIKSPAVSVSFQGIFAKPEKIKDDWKLHIETTIENSFENPKNYVLKNTLLDADGLAVASVLTEHHIEGYEKQVHIQCMENIFPILWNLDNPYLYSVITQISTSDNELDEVKTNVGFRTIRVCANTGFYLNDKQIKLKGSCNHQDHAGIGVALPDAIIEYRLQILKDMGSNAYRCAHNNPSPVLLDLCDRMGILVMDENRALSTSENGIALLKNMVVRDRNHPCVVMYSIFNEEPLQGTPKGRKLSYRLMEEIKKLDDTRPVLGCMNGGFLEENGAAPIFDIAGINYFIDSFDEFHNKFPSVPLVSSELVSAFVTRDNYTNQQELQIYDSYDHNTAPWGQTVREANKAVFSREFIMGMFIWTGFDYRGEPSPYEWPSISSHFGTIDTCGFPKDTYYLYQAYWTDKPVLHVLPHWNWKQGELIKVMTYSNCDEIELYLNNKLISKQYNDIYEQCFWEVEFVPGVLKAIGYRDGVKVAEDSRITASSTKRLKIKLNKEMIYQDRSDALVVNVVALDAEQVLVPIEESLVYFQVEGGVLLGVGNGDPNSHEADVANKRSLFHGRCQGIVSATEGSKEIIIRVLSEEIESDEIIVPVKQRASIPEMEGVNGENIAGWRMSHISQEQKPNPNMIISSTDMNTLEPIEFVGNTQLQLDNKLGEYCIYRTEFDFGNPNLVREVSFPKVYGRIEVYINSVLLLEKLCKYGERVVVKLPNYIKGKSTIVVILRNETIEGKAGIVEPVEFNTY